MKRLQQEPDSKKREVILKNEIAKEGANVAYHLINMGKRKEESCKEKDCCVLNPY